MSIAEIILDLIYPPRCVFCGKITEPGKYVSICSECVKNLPFCSLKTRCTLCGKPIKKGTGSCRECYGNKNNYSFDKIVSVFEYEDDVKKAVLAFKHDARPECSKAFARLMHSVILHDCSKWEFDVVISVPPSRKRMRETGFDQTKALAIELSKLLNCTYLRRAMVQKEERVRQSSLSHNERYENVKGNFLVKKPHEIENKTVLLVDDICTTRSTIHECARVLKNVGAKVVCGATVATVAERGKQH